MDEPDALRRTAVRLASALGVGGAALLGLSPWAGAAHTRTHAGLVLAAAAAAALVAVRWAVPSVPPERLARLALVGSLLLVGATQLALAAGSAGVGAAHAAAEAVGRVAYPLVLLAGVGAIGAALAKSARGPL